MCRGGPARGVTNWHKHPLAGRVGVEAPWHDSREGPTQSSSVSSWPEGGGFLTSCREDVTTGVQTGLRVHLLQRRAVKQGRN